MGTRRRIRIGLLLVAAVGGFAFVVLHSAEPAEPVYNGKPLSYWLEEYTDTNHRVATGAEQAMAEIGTNAIPTLLRMLRAKDYRVKDACMRFAFRIHLIKTAPVPASHRNFQAFMAFHLLGDDAKPAVPELLHILDENISSASRRGVCNSLAAIGPGASNAVPSLLRLTTNGDAGLWNCALNALTEIQPRTEYAVPLLIKGLEHTNSEIRGISAMKLGFYGKNAALAVPKLVSLLKDPDPPVRECAQAALKQIDPEAAAKAGVQ